MLIYINQAMLAEMQFGVVRFSLVQFDFCRSVFENHVIEHSLFGFDTGCTHVRCVGEAFSKLRLPASGLRPSRLILSAIPDGEHVICWFLLEMVPGLRLRLKMETSVFPKYTENNL